MQAILYAASEAASNSTAEDRAAASTKKAAQTDLDPMHVVTNAVAHNVAQSVDVRMTELSTVADAGLGASAGDEDVSKRMHVWLSGIYGASTQGAKGSVAGYKGKLAGGTIGLDTELNEDLILGAAYSNVNSHFKFKQGRTGDKTTARSHVLSLYSQYQFADNYVWKNIVSVSRNNIKTLNYRSGFAVKGKFKSDAFNFDTNLGYKIASNGITYVPNVGLRYGISKDAAYTETGGGVYRQQIGSQKSQSLVGSLGVKAIFKQQMASGLILSPSLHASVDTNLMNKAQKVRAKLVWADNYTESKASTGSKPPKVSYNVGAGVIAMKDNIEVSAEYNCNLAKKYQSHQGTIKLKITF